LVQQVKDLVTVRNINPNVKIVAEKLSQYYSFALGIFINRGSRDEDKTDNGITHLIEHMLFKGTSSKSSLEIVRLIEGLGGSFDAFTTKENLVIVTKFLSEHLIKVFELLSEILFESKFGEEEFIKEKSVIMEEIKSNNEDPSEYIYDLLFDLVFKEHPMSMPIAGTIESVSNLQLKDVQKHYQDVLRCPMIISVSGNFEPDILFDYAQKRFSKSGLFNYERKKPDTYIPGWNFQTQRDISQVHLCFGLPAVGYDSNLRHPLLILNAMLGGGMSSRLFQGLREEHGLVYDVHSFVDFYSDCGIFGFYLSTDKKNIKKIIEELKRIFDNLYTRGFCEDEVELAKSYIIGNLLLSLENSTNRMLRIGREFGYLNKITPVEKTVEKIKSIKVDEINGLLRDYLDLKRYSVSAIGPVDEDWVSNFVKNLKG
jgi:predicted Zn-dependent peptidase